jgi:hypothetical protein
MKAWRKVGRANAAPQIVWPKFALMSTLLAALLHRAGING